MALSTLKPGLEVELRGGVRGVLYSRVCTLGRRPPRNRHERWYFLPDDASAPGVVVMRQPREIGPDEVRSTGDVRPGPWPPEQYRLADSERSAVYAAHMQGRALPTLGR